MANEPSWQDLYDIGKAAMQVSRPSLVVAEGDVTDAVLCAASSVGTAVLARNAGRVRALFLDGAEGDDLTSLAHDRGVDRFPGAGSVGEILFSRPTFALGGGVIAAGFRIATQPDATGFVVTVRTDEDVVFGPTDLAKSVFATSIAVGRAGNVAIGTLQKKVGDPLFDPSIVVTNTSRFAGGAETERDEDLRDRVRGFFLTQARGTMDALIFGAKQVAGVSRVSLVVDDSGVVTVFVSDALGGGSPAMVSAVTRELEKWRAATDVIYVTGGVLYGISIVLSLTVRTGVSIAALASRIRKAVVSRMERLNPGETMYRSMIEAAVRDVDRDAITDVVVVSPTTNLRPSPNQLLRTTESDVSFA